MIRKGKRGKKLLESRRESIAPKRRNWSKELLRVQEQQRRLALNRDDPEKTGGKTRSVP